MSGQEPNKEELKLKLKQKIQAKEAQRKQQSRSFNNQFKCDDDDEITSVSMELIKAVPFVIKRTGKSSVPQLDDIFKKVQKYNKLRTKYFHLYRGILSGQVNPSNFHLLGMLLNERAKERQNVVESEKANLNVGYKLAAEYNVDVAQLVKTAKELAEKEKEEKKE